MRMVSSMFGMNNLSFFLVILIIGTAALLSISPVSADYGYTQKWIGSPAWLDEKVNVTILNQDLYGRMQAGDSLDSVPTDINTGKEQLKGGSYAAAKESFENAINLDGNISDAWAGRGLAQEGLKHYQLALDSFNSAIDLSTNNKYIWLVYAGKARALLELQKYQDAFSSYNLAIEKYSSSGSSDKSDLINLYEGIADALEKLGKKTESGAALKKANELRS